MNIVITGGASGLGLSFTKAFAKLDNHVFVLYNNSKEMANYLEKEYQNITCIKCDITNEKEVIKACNKINNIDILINNASIAIDNYYYDKSIDEFMDVLKTNIGGTYQMIKYSLPILNKRAIIINISSDNAINNYNPISIDYDVSKVGINMLTKEFKIILDDNKLDQKIISICPGWINTLSVKEMNQLYLQEELKRAKQEKLIEPDDLVKNIIANLDNYTNGDIIEMREI